MSTLIRKSLADLKLAHDDMFRRVLQGGLEDLIDAGAAAVRSVTSVQSTRRPTGRL
ncbi:hypothetical protein OHJ16_02550 [Actinomyces israelii]|uniref:Transposase n=1 Tax=Actinomyces israelii TaxID=1659 RepID=A0ABT4I5B7_9ACTO|nr:hypothetical protein [Actinomyces israelii]MCZ0856934.1 hypothetical protein [Actinomyces israelii]